MTPGRIKLRQAYGTALNRTMRCVAKADGSPWPFAGCAGLWQIRPSAGSDSVLLQGGTTDGRMTLVDGQISINTDDLSPSAMQAALPVGIYTFGLSISSGNSGWVPYLEGTIEVYKQGART